MPFPTTNIGPIHTQTYTFLLGLSIILCLFYTTLSYRWRLASPPGAVVDVLLASLIGGIVVARAFHVVLNRVYFEAHPDEITAIDAGGLNWHGAVVGAVVAGYFMAHLRHVRWSLLLNSLSFALPIIAFAAWWGCGANHCAYGAEVDNLSNYPGFLVWEERDIFNIIAPRYATQRFGMMWSVGVFIVLFILTRLDRRGKLPGSFRFWVSLLLLSAGMFWLGALRGDYAEFRLGLREDQWLDVLFISVSLVMVVRGLWRHRNETGRREKYRD